MIGYQEAGGAKDAPGGIGLNRKIASGIAGLLYPHFARYNQRVAGGGGPGGIAKSLLMQNMAAPHIGRY